MFFFRFWEGEVGLPDVGTGGFLTRTTVAGDGGMYQEELASDRPKDGWSTGERSQVLKPQNE